MEIGTEEKKRKSLRYSIFDGIFNSIKIGFGESFFAAFATFLKANNLQLGLLGSVPQTFGSLAQLLSNRLLNLFRSRKRFVYISALLEGLVYVPIALVFFLGTFRVFHLILFVCLYRIFGMILDPVWNSWMGDLVNQKERGFYFSKRNKINSLISFLSLLFAGFILQRFTNGETTQYIGFGIIFLIALVSRIISFVYLTKKYEPEYKILLKPYFTFIEFIKQARFRNHGLLVLYLCATGFAVFLAAPFFVAYMLYDLKFSYMFFTIVNATSLITKFFSLSIWGKASDKYGPRKVLSLAGFLMPLIPLLWLVSKNPFYIVAIQTYAGFVWAGFDIASLNFIFDTTSSEKRATCIAYYNALHGVTIFFGAIFGGLIVRYNNLFWSKYMLVFLISGILRYVVSFIFVPKLKEVREVEHIPHHELFLKITMIKPTFGFVYNLITFRRRKKE